MKIKFLLEYQCNPIWIYDDKGQLISNGLTSFLENEIGNNITEKLNKIQNDYDNLFENSKILFEYKGFQNDDDRRKFIINIQDIEYLIKTKIGKKYDFEMQSNLSEL